MSLISFFKNISLKRKYKRTILAINIAVWKRPAFNKYFEDANLVYVPLKNDIYDYVKYVKRNKETEILIWGYKECRNVTPFAEEFSIPVTRVEDGFLRSFGLGLDKTIPYSLCFDTKGLYYNSTIPSDFEKLANAHNEVISNEMLEYAKLVRHELIDCSVTKYYLKNAKRLSYPKKTGERILVIGQVETDQSIVYSGSVILTNLDLVKYVRQMYPDAELVFKQHPDDIKKETKIDTIRSIADFVISENVFINDLLTDIDRVYTISSLLGFEALIRGKSVYTTGLPFYAGWGLTNDLIKCERRKAKLTLDELTAIAYLLYPSYYDRDYHKIPAKDYIDSYIDATKQCSDISGIGFIKLSKKSDKNTELELTVENAINQNLNNNEKNKAGNLKQKNRLANIKINKPKNDIRSDNDTELKTDNKPKKNIDLKQKDEIITKLSNDSNVISKSKQSPYIIPDNGRDYDMLDILNFKNSFEIKSAVKSNKKFFLYIEWITHHTDDLVNKLNSADFDFIPLNMVAELTVINRKLLSKFSKNEPLLYRNYIRNRLLNLKDYLYGLVVTFDWAPITRIAVEVCHELKIYTVLIPHESIFINRDLFYRHPETFASRPVCNEALVWGDAQKDVYVSRGYEEGRIVMAGSPKLDGCIDYHPELTAEQFARFYCIAPGKKVILFACQNLDIQIDTKLANISQNQAIRQIIDFCTTNNAHLIVRLPPSAKDILFQATKTKITECGCCFVDRAPMYLSSPRDAVFYSAAVISLNSTMLLEAALMKRPAISVRLIDGINSLWNESLVPIARTADELLSLLSRIISEEWGPHENASAEFSRLASLLGVGTFDGKSVARIKSRLAEIVSGKDLIASYDVKAAFFDKLQIDVMRIPSSVKVLDTTQKYLRTLLGCNTLLSKAHQKIKDLSAVELFVQWGIQPNAAKQEQQVMARELCRDTIYIEDGFIRSCNIGLSGEPGLSIICDDLSSYYDATSPTRLETILSSDAEFSDEELSYARKIINMILETKVSKYNTAPLRKYNVGRDGYPKVLLIDQRFNDYSVVKGMGSEKSFDDMLTDAINNFPDRDILIKQHPDAFLGAKGSYFNKNKLSFINQVNNIFVIDFDINPYDLLSQVDEVYVCTSGMGFEALMAGKKVTCYGMPWYAGYGITEDRQSVSRRNKKRSLEELFYVAYVKLSRYCNPDIDQLCNIEDVIDYIVRNR